MCIVLYIIHTVYGTCEVIGKILTNLKWAPERVRIDGVMCYLPLKEGVSPAHVPKGRGWTSCFHRFSYLTVLKRLST